MLRSFQWWYRTCQRVHSGSYEVIYFHIIFVRNRTGRRGQYSHGSRCSGAFPKHGNELPLSIRGTEFHGQAIKYELSQQEIYFMELVKMTSIYALREFNERHIVGSGAMLGKSGLITGTYCKYLPNELW